MDAMKFLIAIVQDYDCDKLLRTVTGYGYRATRISSTGGFLRTGNTTVLMGVEDDQVERCIGLIRQSCRTRTEVKLDAANEYAEWFAAGVHEVTVGGAVVFVLKVARFEQIQAHVAPVGAGGSRHDR
jgi:uncharacterized protein YaaQ